MTGFPGSGTTTLPGTPAAPPVGLDEVASRTRSNCQGPLVLGEDLMRFTGGNTIIVHKGDPQRKSYPG